MADFQQAGNVLLGLSAGLQGRGPEFVANQQAMQRQQGLDQQAQEKQRQQMELERQKTVFTDSAAALNFAKQNRFDLVVQLGMNRLESSKLFPEADFSDTRELTQMATMAANGDQKAADMLTKTLENNVEIGRGIGVLPPPEGDKFIKAENGQAIVRTTGGEFVAKDITGAKKPEEDQAEFRKEQRSIAASTVKTLNNRATEINSAFGKVSSLVERIESPKSSNSAKRSAIGAALMSVARLVSPGVVTDSDFRAISGASDPMQAALGFLSGSNDSGLLDLRRSFDVTNPETFDAQGLLETAKSVVGSEAPSIISQFEEAKSQAERANLNKRALDTFFGGKNSGIDALRKFGTRQNPLSLLPQGTTDNKDGTFTLPDGRKVRRSK